MSIMPTGNETVDDVAERLQPTAQMSFSDSERRRVATFMVNQLSAAAARATLISTYKASIANDPDWAIDQLAEIAGESDAGSVAGLVHEILQPGQEAQYG